MADRRSQYLKTRSCSNRRTSLFRRRQCPVFHLLPIFSDARLHCRLFRLQAQRPVVSAAFIWPANGNVTIPRIDCAGLWRIGNMAFRICTMFIPILYPVDPLSCLGLTNYKWTGLITGIDDTRSQWMVPFQNLRRFISIIVADECYYSNCICLTCWHWQQCKDVANFGRCVPLRHYIGYINCIIDTEPDFHRLAPGC